MVRGHARNRIGIQHHRAYALAYPHSYGASNPEAMSGWPRIWTNCCDAA